MTLSGPQWVSCLSVACYSHASASSDSSAAGDHFRVAVAIKAHKIDLSYLAVNLSDYAEMMPVATCFCQPVVAIP